MARDRQPWLTRTWRESIAAGALFLALTVLLTYPLSLSPATTSLPLGPDGDLFMWTLAWDTHAFVHQPLSIFDANIFHPESDTLAYSENLIGSAFFAAPVLWLTGNPVLALNVVAMLSCLLCGLGAYVLARRLGLGPAAAVLCGIVFAFAPARFFRTGQLHLGPVQWIPFALASAHAYLDTGSRLHLRLVALLFTLQALSSGHGVVFLGFALVLFGAWRLAAGDPLAPVRRLRDLGVTGVLLILPTVLVFLPYRRVQQEMGLRRTLENWAIDPASFLASPTHVQTWLVGLASPGARILVDAQAFLFPGYLPVLLALALVLWPAGAGVRMPSRWARAGAKARAWLPLLLELATVLGLAVGLTVLAIGPIRLKSEDWVLFSAREAWRPLLVAAVALAARIALLRRVPLAPASRLRRTRDAWRAWAAAHRRSVPGFYGVLTVFATLFAIGPPLGLWPLVYWLPGLNFIRVPSRFTILAMLGLAVLAAAGFERLTGRMASRRRAWVGVLAGALMVVEFAAIPLATIPYAVEIPLADRWLASRAGPFAVAEFPLPDPANAGAFSRRQTQFMLHSMAHWQKTVHGHSGFQPAFHDDLYERMRRFPDADVLDRLASIGVRYLVIHTDLYEPGEWEAVRERVEREPRLSLEHVAGAGRVYALRTW